MKKIVAEDLLEAGVHLGHKAARLHPRFAQFIYSSQNGSSIIDLFKTVEKLEEVRQFVYDLGKQGKTLLVVATKKQAKQSIASLCEEKNIMSVTNKWVAGLLTNFSEISKNIKKMHDMRQAKKNGDWEIFVKHEQVALEKKLRKIENIYSVIEGLKKIPDALFLVDIKQEAVATDEARKMRLPSIALVDSNSDPDLVTYSIPGNDDAISSINYLVPLIIEAYTEGRTTVENKKKEK